MARQHHLPPSASSLSASLRDLGYSLETAVADLIDNSISADATEIDIFCETSSGSAVFAIVDNGTGMTESQLIAAMRHGATDPRKTRGARDLGRFGLGLKTASFSQCRRLTVIARKDGTTAAAEWALDDLEQKDDWILQVFDDEELLDLPYLGNLGRSGTLVLWRQLDRLEEDETGRRRDELINEKLFAVERHLSLVFHRFLAGELKGRKKLSIRLNGSAIEPFDPFCRSNPATQVLPTETIWLEDEPVVMQPYILPHHSRLSATEYDFYQDRSDFISNQGAYVYRSGRLMAWGDWFRLVPKGEPTKLARVRVDFSNALDEAWTIDIKKSRARPPAPVRDRLAQVISRISGRSVIVHRGRGQKLYQDAAAPIWERYADHDGIRYAVNSQHPLVLAAMGSSAEDGSRALKVLLESLGASLPVEMVYSDYSTQPRAFSKAGTDLVTALGKVAELRVAIYGAGPIDQAAFLQILHSTRMFEKHIEDVTQYIKENFR